MHTMHFATAPSSIKAPDSLSIIFHKLVSKIKAVKL